MAAPYGWTVGTTQSDNVGRNFVLSDDGTITCRVSIGQ